MRKLLLVLLALFLMSQWNIAQTKKTWTLQQCMDTALARNRNIKQQRIVIGNKNIALEQARKNLLPSISFDATHTLALGRTLGEGNTYLSKAAVTNNSVAQLSGSIILFSGFKLRNTICMKQTDQQTAIADLDKSKINVSTNILAAYLQVLLNRELLQLAKTQLQLSKNKLEQRKILVENGRLPEGDLLEIYSEAAKEELNKVQAENSLSLSFLDLAQLMEVEDSENYDIVVPTDFDSIHSQILSVDEIYQKAIKNRPEVRSAESQLRYNEYALKIAYAGLYPTLSLNTSVGSAFYADNSGTGYNSFEQQISDKINGNVVLTLSVPLFDKFATRNNIRSTRLNIQSSKLAIDDAKIQLRKAIQQAYFDAKNAQSKWLFACKSVDAATESNRFVDQKYEAGKATVYELYQSKNNLTQALSEQIQAKYEYLFKVRLLDLYK